MTAYACSDLHGNYELFKKVISYLKADDTLYFLGDAADRGEDGYQIIKELLSDPRVKYIKGNHEQMFVDASIHTPNTTEEDTWDLYFDASDKRSLFFYNGGYSTWLAWEAEGYPKDIINNIKNLPLFDKYINKNRQTIILSHSGNIEDIWDRQHFLIIEEIPEDTFYVHGHTPISYIKKSHQDRDKIPYIYNNGHKIDIDCGTAQTNTTVLLNLDTLESIVVK